jgi:hypothetical protein
MSKTFKIVGNDISDGYHTFEELYKHRIALFIKLCNFLGGCYIQKDHYEGWDAVYLHLPEGQISYHIPSSYRDKLPRAVEVDGDFYDGHTSSEVVDRLLG